MRPAFCVLLGILHVMKNPILRLVLVVLSLAGAGGAGYYAFAVEQRSSALREADRVFTDEIVRLQATLADLRASQAGYLATGQDTAVWIEKVRQLRQQADSQLKRLQNDRAGEDALVTGVGTSLASFDRLDARVQEALRSEQPLTASSLIFSDASETLTTAMNGLGAARGARSTRSGAALARWRMQELYAVGGAAGFLLVVMLLLLPGKPARPEAGAAELGSTEDDFTEQADVEVGPARQTLAGTGGAADMDFDLKDWARKEAGAGTIGTQAGPDARGPAHAPGAMRAAIDEDGRRVEEVTGGRVPSVDLAAAARLCTDLARVHDTSELQELLARAAALLDATGIVVWMGSQDGQVIWPAFSHGYSPQSLTKMQALPRDGSTPVSMAFRKGLMEVVPAADRNSGAIVAPILTAAGCVGAMAVEVPHGAERSDAAQALSSIVAAQLATLVAGENAQ